MQPNDAEARRGHVGRELWRRAGELGFLGERGSATTTEQ
jgi:hypothetical protein